MGLFKYLYVHHAASHLYVYKMKKKGGVNMIEFFFFYGPPHMAVQKQDDQHEHTFSSYVRIRDVVLKTYLGRWTIGRSGERGSGISVLPARYDDDDDVRIQDVALKTCQRRWTIGKSGERGSGISVLPARDDDDVRIRDVAKKTCQRRWTIGRNGERGSGISVLAARHDDNDDEIVWNGTVSLYKVGFDFE